MNTKMLLAAAALILPLAMGAGVASAKAPMNYDCSKAGNANKAVCKANAVTTQAKPASAMTSSSASSKATKAMASASSVAKKPMNYDCTKAGNANKAACKSAMSSSSSSAAKPMAPMAPMTNAMAPKPAAPKPAAPKPMASGSSNPNIVAMTTKNGKIYHYDCSKAGNKDLKVCKGK